ncbi:MAG: DUF3489 domain-containing protein [Magnetococcus sp. YQC-5]
MTNLTLNTLTPAQQTILEAAASRTDGSIHPVPDYLKGGASKKVIKVLKAKGLINDFDRITALGYSTVDPNLIAPESTDETPADLETESADEIIDKATEDQEEASADEAPENLVQETSDEPPTSLAMEPNDADDTTTTEALATDDDDPATAMLLTANGADTAEEATDATMIPSTATETSEANEPLVADTVTRDTVTYETNASIGTDKTTVEDEETANELPASLGMELATDVDDEAEAFSAPEAAFNATYEPPTDFPLETINPTNFEQDVVIAEQALAEIKPRRTRDDTKKAKVIAMLKRPEGATAAQIAEATGWQGHTIRGFLSIAKKKLGLDISTNRVRMVGPNKQGSPGSFTTYFAE